jgi:hypothetical protein
VTEEPVLRIDDSLLVGVEEIAGLYLESIERLVDSRQYLT